MALKTYSVREAAGILSVSLTHFYHLLWSNRFAGAERRDGRWAIPVSAIESYKKEQLARAGGR